MNERIKELATEAFEYALGQSPSNDEFQPIWTEKFAELIIRHCTYQCYLIGESGLAHELSDEFGFKFDFRKMMEEDE